MADKDQLKSDEEKHNAEPEVTELDDKALEEASGGTIDDQESLADGNNNCLC